MDNPTIKAGQTWIMRNGQTITIDTIVPEDPHPLKHGKQMAWQANGRYWDDEFDSKMDLIRIVEQ